jgi:hypothetical protein
MGKTVGIRGNRLKSGRKYFFKMRYCNPEVRPLADGDGGGIASGHGDGQPVNRTE